jgi:hypothetical protein
MMFVENDPKPQRLPLAISRLEVAEKDSGTFDCSSFFGTMIS